jgi:hypothetical protein
MKVIFHGEGIMEEFEKELEWFAEVYANMIGEIKNALRYMKDEELENLMLLCDKPDKFNCWWAVNEVAPIVKREVKIRLAQNKII